VSYLKLFKMVADFALGFQSINQARDNGEAIKDLYAVRHAMGINGFNPPSGNVAAQRIGKHNDILIARSVADFEVDTALATPVLVPRVAGPVFGNLFAQRMAAGQWRIFIATPRLFAAVALLKSTASVDRKANCYVAFDPNRGPSIIVTTWEQDIGTWTKADLPFSLAVWTQA